MKALTATLICFLSCYILDHAMTGGRYSDAVATGVSQIYTDLYYWSRR